MKKRNRNLILSVAAFAGLGMAPGCSTTDKTAPAQQAHVGTYARPDWATASQLVGRIDQSQQLSLQIHLQNRNQDALKAEIAAISDPDSPSYRHFLSSAEFAAKYAPTEADVATVRKHLEANGLTVSYVPNNRAYIAVSGTAKQVESAFATKLGSYKVSGQVRYAPMSEPAVPAALQPLVLGVLGLHTATAGTPRKVTLGGIPRSSLNNVKPHADGTLVTCSEWFGSLADTVDPAYPGYPPLTYAPCGYTPGQVRAAYGFRDIVRQGTDGSNQTVAIIDAWLSPTLVQDATIYAANHDPDYPLAEGQLTTVWAPGETSPPDTGWYGEQTLDVEAVHATAPGADILAVAAQSNSFVDLISAFNLIIDGNLADIISNSWGSVEGYAPDYVVFNSLFQQAAAKGIGIYFSSGDNGDNLFSFGQPYADFPASSDLVTAVGGTSLAIGATGNTIFETGWQTGVSFAEQTSDDPTAPLTWFPDPPGFWYFGGGGGTSTVYAQPKWQAGIVPPELANAQHPGINAPARVIPDLAALGDPVTGFLVGQTDPFTGVYSEYAIGGTSLSCPLIAGVVAVAQQNIHKSYGFINPALYKASKKSAFRDISTLETPVAVVPVAGVVTTFSDDAELTIHVGPGFDAVTGLGVPNGAAFLKALK